MAQPWSVSRAARLVESLWLHALPLVDGVAAVEATHCDVKVIAVQFAGSADDPGEPTGFVVAVPGAAFEERDGRRPGGTKHLVFL